MLERWGGTCHDEKSPVVCSLLEVKWEERHMHVPFQQELENKQKQKQKHQHRRTEVLRNPTEANHLENTLRSGHTRSSVFQRVQFNSQDAHIKF